MAKFIFRLQPVLMVREMREEAAQRELADSEQARRAAAERLAGTRRRLESTLRAEGAGRVDVWQRRHVEHYREALTRRRAAQETELADRSRVVDEKRDSLIEAMQEKRVLERLREKQEFAFRSREAARLTRELDEAGLMTFRFNSMVKGGE